jgi:hypothetical protein
LIMEELDPEEIAYIKVNIACRFIPYHVWCETNNWFHDTLILYDSTSIQRFWRCLGEITKCWIIE